MDPTNLMVDIKRFNLHDRPSDHIGNKIRIKNDTQIQTSAAILEPF